MMTVEARIENLEYIREWIFMHPDRVDPEVAKAARDWCHSEITSMRREVKRNELTGCVGRL